MQIVPMRDLKDTVKIENMCSETKAPVFVSELPGNWITKHRLCDDKPSLLWAVPTQYCYLFLGYTDTFIILGFDNPFIGIVISIPFSFLYILIILYAPTESELYTILLSLYNPLLILFVFL